MGGILSRRQHGQVKTIGLGLYARLLEQAIQEVKTGQPIEPTVEVSINLPLSFGLPISGIPQETDRLRWYQRLSRCQNLSTLTQERRRLLARYPQLLETAQTQVENFFYILELRLLAEAGRLSTIKMETRTGPSGDKRRRFVLESNHDLNLTRLGKLLEKNYHWQISHKKLRLEEEWISGDWQGELKEAITILGGP